MEKRISNYCISDVTTQLNDIKDLEFLSHDNDDFIKRHTILEYNSKTPLKNRNKYKDFFTLNEEDIITQLNNSEHIKGYELIKDLDPNVSVENSIDLNHLLPIEKNHYYYDNEKIFMRILKRKKGNELKIDNNIENFRRNTNTIEPFTISKFEQIEKIDKIETIKIDDNNIPIFNKKKSSVIKIEIRPNNNFWGEIKQPKGDLIDRDASTKIKYDNKTFTNNLYEIPEDNEKHEMIISTNKENINYTQTKEKTTKMAKNHKITKKKDLNSSKALLDNKQKKIRIIPIELPSYDLEPEKSNNIEEPYIKEMRRNIEIEIKKKKKEELQERKEKENKEKQKFLSNKPKILNRNVTVDIKGKIVYIRPIKYESLINEFKNMRSTSKDVAEIKDDTIIDKKFDNVTVIKNNVADLFQNNNNNNNNREKSGKIRRNTSTTNNSKSEYSFKNDKNEKNKEITKTPDRNRMKFASGSNFEIINLECGVKLIENQKIKTGGKDFFRKYGRCSFEIFQEQLNRTSSGYYHNDNNNYINVNINDNENDSNIKNDIKQDNSGLPYIIKQKFKKEKSDYDILNTMPNSSNNYLNLKTTNLKTALNNLDLINEDNNNGNILNNTKDKKLEKKDYGEINKFNKTLLKNKLWGEPTDSFQTQYMSRMFPIKPDQKYLLRDLSKNELNYSPRKRLPPLATTQRIFGTQIDKNESGKNIKNKRPINKKLKELKKKNLSKDDIYNNKRKNFFSTTNSYYNNTEKGLSPIIKI